MQTRAEEIAERDRPSDDPAERAWAAGLFEGEGSVSPVNHNHNGRSYRYIRLTMQMTDEDVLRRFAAVMGGRVTGPHSRGPLGPSSAVPDVGARPYKDYWSWALRGDIRPAVAAMWPWLGERRRARMTELGVAP